MSFSPVGPRSFIAERVYSFSPVGPRSLTLFDTITFRSIRAAAFQGKEWANTGGVGYLAGSGPAYAKDVENAVPASGAVVEVWSDGEMVKKTTADSGGVWEISRIPHQQVYDVVGRYSTFEGVISTKRTPKLMPLSVVELSNYRVSSTHYYRIAVQDFSAPLAIDVNGNPITATIENSSGFVFFSVGLDSTTYTATISDSTGRTYDYQVVAPSP